MNQMMKLPETLIKITMVNVWKDLVEKVDNMHEHMRHREEKSIKKKTQLNENATNKKIQHKK